MTIQGVVAFFRPIYRLLVGRLIDRMRRHLDRSQDINDYTEELSVEIDHYEEKDYTEVDNTIEHLGLSGIFLRRSISVRISKSFLRKTD